MEAKKGLKKLYFDKTSYKDFDSAQSTFLRLVEAPTESVILIIIYYMFKYSFGTKTTLLELLRSQKSTLKDMLRQLVIRILLELLRSDFLRLVGALNKSFGVIIIYYMFKFSIGIKTTLVQSLRRHKKAL